MATLAPCFWLLAVLFAFYLWVLAARFVAVDVDLRSAGDSFLFGHFQNKPLFLSTLRAQIFPPKFPTSGATHASSSTVIGDAIREAKEEVTVMVHAKDSAGNARVQVGQNTSLGHHTASLTLALVAVSPRIVRAPFGPVVLAWSANLGLLGLQGFSH